MPAPIRPVQPGDAISAAKFNEVVDALNALGRINGAFPICVSQDAAGVRIELAQQFKAWLFQIEETPGEVPRTTDGVAFYSATRVRLDNADEYAAQEPQHVRLYDPLTRVSPERVLRTGDWALATFNADTGRWEIVRDTDGGVPIVRFRTTATLAVGGSAAAVLVNRVDGADVDGDEITVVDWSAPGTWYAPTGSQGIACKIPDRDDYDILWIEHPKLFAVGEATDVMVAGVLPVTITTTWDGAATDGDTDNFYDVAGNYASAAPGDQFVASFDPASRTFKIIDGPPGGNGLIRFVLYAHIIEGGSAEARLVIWDGAAWIPNLDAIFTVWDSELLGPAVKGTRGWCSYRSDSMRYEIVSLDDELVRFQLVDPLPKNGGPVDANPIVSDGVGGWVRDGGTVIEICDPLGFGPATADTKGWAVYKPDNGRYEVVSYAIDPSPIGWFKADDDHTLDIADFSLDHFVTGQVCANASGGGVAGPSLRFYLPCPTDALCPNVKYGAVLGYTTDPTGRRVALAPYLDSNRGASRQHVGSTATIPFGWHLCDGGMGTPDLRSQFLLMAFGDDPNDPNFDEHGHGDEIGAQGGTKGHNHFDSLNQDDPPTAGTLHHYSHLMDDIETDDTELRIKGSLGQTVDTSETNLAVTGTATAADGAYTGYEIVTVSGETGVYSASSWTGYAKTDLEVYDTTTNTNTHPSHDHEFGSTAHGCFDGAYWALGDGAAHIYTGPPLRNVDYPSGDPITDCDHMDAGQEFRHDTYEPGDLVPGTLGVYDPHGDPNIDPGGEKGHRHALAGDITFVSLTLTETYPGHKHSLDDLEITLDAAIDPDPHKHTVLIASIAAGLYIVDETNYGDDDAAHYNFHHHHVQVDDHQLLPANHIPPYYALAQIMRIN